MTTLIKSATVKARKAHCCMNCGAVAILPGQTYERNTCVYDGRIYDWVSCDDCNAIAGLVYDYWGEPDEGIGEDSYVDWACEHENDPEHGPAARAFLARRDEQ